MNDRLEPRIRILLGSSIAIGPGKAALLEAIGETGSIAAAGRRMGMSYRRAWVLAKTMSACFREPLIGAHPHGKPALGISNGLLCGSHGTARR
jgi:molybdate transport system regulatory protein